MTVNTDPNIRINIEEVDAHNLDISDGFMQYDSQKNSIIDIVKSLITIKNSKNSFFIIDLGSVKKRYDLWMKYLPNVQIRYAVKCNPDKEIIKLMVKLGIGFDVASENEMLDLIKLGADPKKIIFANPIKDVSAIMMAESMMVDLMTFDSESELIKISMYYPECRLVLRIKVSDSRSRHPLGSKFGCPKEKYDSIISLCKKYGLNLVGVSFHVGSDCTDAKTYCSAIKNARRVFNIASKYSYNMKLLDIGGGFPGKPEYEENMITIMEKIKYSLGKYFNDINDLEVIAEPGRYMVTTCGIAVTNVIGKKNNNSGYQYYINSSIYGVFNNIVFDNARPVLLPVKKVVNKKRYTTTIFGQTCDSIDIISKNIEYPELDVGEWLYVENYGAYTNAAASKFNGFDYGKIEYIYIR